MTNNIQPHTWSWQGRVDTYCKNRYFEIVYLWTNIFSESNTVMMRISSISRSASIQLSLSLSIYLFIYLSISTYMQDTTSKHDVFINLLPRRTQRTSGRGFGRLKLSASLALIGIECMACESDGPTIMISLHMLLYAHALAQLSQREG